jgi:hypothetical protein
MSYFALFVCVASHRLTTCSDVKTLIYFHPLGDFKNILF